jgi:hypothetical protein
MPRHTCPTIDKLKARIEAAYKMADEPPEDGGEDALRQCLRDIAHELNGEAGVLEDLRNANLKLMDLIRRLIKQLFCRHHYEWYYNLYGDQIISWGYKRSVWKCTKCELLQGREKLHDPKRSGDLRGVAGPLPEHGWD